jgi:hypothetical protein
MVFALPLSELQARPCANFHTTLTLFAMYRCTGRELNNRYSVHLWVFSRHESRDMKRQRCTHDFR